MFLPRLAVLRHLSVMNAAGVYSAFRRFGIFTTARHTFLYRSRRIHKEGRYEYVYVGDVMAGEVISY